MACPKLILSMDGLVLKEVLLDKPRLTIGRKPGNDIQIDNMAISGAHAVIVTILQDSFLEDLNSTNGTKVNGQAVRKHFLQANDVIELGKYQIKYLIPLAEDVVTVSSTPPPVDAAPAASTFRGAAKIRLMSGPSMGREMALVKPLTTLGKPGVQVASIVRQPDGAYALRHVEGAVRPLLNGQRMGAADAPLSPGDRFEIAGISMQLMALA